VNFGWNVGEGNHCAVVGGYVYRGAQYPAMQGAYLYGDECSGRMWSLSRDAAGAWSTAELGRTGVAISAFGEDDTGEMYVTGFGDGVVYHVTAQ
jgi:hypothetical protein